MKLEVEQKLTTCILCYRPMDHSAVKPTWVFDLEEGKLRGKAHATCVWKSKLPYDCSKRVDGTTPTEAQIKFAVKLHRFREDHDRPPTRSIEMYAFLLTSSTMYNTSNVDELLSSSRAKELLDWWQNGSKIISAEEAEHIPRFLRTKLEALK